MNKAWLTHMVMHIDMYLSDPQIDIKSKPALSFKHYCSKKLLSKKLLPLLPLLFCYWKRLELLLFITFGLLSCIQLHPQTLVDPCEYIKYLLTCVCAYVCVKVCIQFPLGLQQGSAGTWLQRSTSCWSIDCSVG